MKAGYNNVFASPESVRAIEEYLVETGRKIEKAEQRPIIEEINGKTHVFFDKEVHVVDKEHERDLPQPDAFEAFSLQGLVDYINNDPDCLDYSGTFTLHVADESNVELLSPVTGYNKRRYVLAKCRALVPCIRFSQFMDADDFQVMLQSKFVENDNRNKVLMVAGNLSSEQNVQKADDGVSQRITVQQGVASASTVTIKNPVVLTPYRTFHEIEQPSSAFVLRFNERSNCALFEGDGGLWRVEAVRRIGEWLKQNIYSPLSIQIIA